MFLIPLNRPLKPLTEIDLRPEPELPLRARDVQAPPGLAVGFSGVPDDLARIPGEVGDEGCEVADGDL